MVILTPNKPYGILTNPDLPDDAAQVQDTPPEQQAPQQKWESVPAPIPTIRSAPQKPVFQPNPERQKLEQYYSDRLEKLNAPRPPAQGFWGHAGRILQGIGNIAGDIFAPQTMALIPGTQMHKSMERGQDMRQLGGLQEQDQQDEQQFGQEQLRGSQAHEADVRANALENPPDKPDKFTFQQTDHGLMRIDGTTGEATPVTFNGQVLQPKIPAEKDVNAKEQVQRALLDAENKGDKASVAKYQQQLKDMDPTAQQRLGITIRGQDIAGENRDAKSDTVTRQAAFKAFQPSLDSGERFNVMAKNYEDAIRSHDQQAMLSLLANHLGMTMGLQKGSRLTRDIIREAQQSRPWLQGIAAQFDKDGVLSGVTLTPNQMRQMVDLGRGRFTEDTTKARSEARYLGATDDGPDRIPSKATINFYLAEAHGDAARAKQLAAEDGWTVK